MQMPIWNFDKVYPRVYKQTQQVCELAYNKLKKIGFKIR